MEAKVKKTSLKVRGDGDDSLRPLKVLIFSHGPDKKTGFGGQVNALSSEFRRRGWDVVRLCLHSWNKTGRTTSEDGSRLYRVHKFPSDVDVFQCVYKEDPDAIILASELSWAAAFHGLPEEIRQRCIFWSAIDCEPVSKPLMDMANNYGTVVNASDFGHSMYKDAGILESSKIYMGADPAVFKPLPEDDRDALRREYKLEDKFVMLHVGQNQHRKQQPVALEVFKIFMGRHPEPFLILHTPQFGYIPGEFHGGWDLGKLKNEILEIPDSRACWSKTEESQAGMAELYNMADVYTDFSASEGFGIPRVEAQMCGLRTVVPDNTTGPELQGPGSIIYGCKNIHWQPDLTVKRPLPDPDALLEAWESAYDMWKSGEIHKGRAERHKWAKSRYNIREISKKWADLVERRARPPRPAIEVRTKVLYQGIQSSNFSYGILSSELARALDGLGYDVRRYPVTTDAWRDKHLGTENSNARLTEKTFGGAGFDVHIRLAYPLLADGLVGRKNLCITPYEWPAPPPSWVDHAHDPRIHRIVAISDGLADIYRAAGMPPEKVRAIHLGVDHEIFNTDVASDPLDGQKAFSFLMLGSLMEFNSRKRMDLGLEAFLLEFQKHEDVSLVIKTLPLSGKDVTKDQVGEACRRAINPARVIYVCGSWPRQRVAGLMASADAILSPVAGEGCGMVNREAMAMGIPTVGTAVGGLKDVLSDKTGYPIHAHLVAGPKAAYIANNDVPDGGWKAYHGDLSELRFQMREAFERRGYKSKRRACLNMARKFTWENTAKELRKIIRETSP